MNIEIPDNIQNFIKRTDGVSIDVVINHPVSSCGCNLKIRKTIVLSILNRSCNRCGYDYIFNPDGGDGDCGHSNCELKYVPVFVWQDFDNATPLEKAFSIWLDAYEKRGRVQVMTFGRTL